MKKKYCCDKFAKYTHKLSIGLSSMSIPHPFIWLAFYTYGSVELVENIHERIDFCPFCGEPLEKEKE